MAGDAAELHPEVNARLDALIISPDFDRVEADVIRVGAGGNCTAGVVGNIEFARQSVEVAILKDVVMDRAGVGHHVDEFAGIEAAGGGGGDVADVVGAGALGGEAEVGEFHQNFSAILGHDFSDLQIGASGQIGVAGAPVSGDFGKAAELIAAERATGDAAAEHEAFLRRGDEEKSVEFVAEDVAILWKHVGLCVGENGVVTIKPVFFVFDLLFAAELIDGCAKDGLYGFRRLMSEAVFRILTEKGEIARLQDSRYESGEVGGLLLTEA